MCSTGVSSNYYIKYHVWDPIECTLILHLVYVLHWSDDGCFTAKTCSPDVIDIHHRVDVHMLCFKR